MPIYVIKRFENMSMYILTLSFSIFAIISLLNAPSLAVVILVLMLAYTLAALYLNKSLIMINSFVTFIALFFIQYMIKALFASTVKQINQIINHIIDKTQNVLIEANKGYIATQDGQAFVQQVNESFENIQKSFASINNYISDEIDKVDNLAAIFSSINTESSSIASVAEEHAASTQELMATFEEHNANVEDIYNLLLHIKESSENLQKKIIK